MCSGAVDLPHLVRLGAAVLAALDVHARIGVGHLPDASSLLLTAEVIRAERLPTLRARRDRDLSRLRNKFQNELPDDHKLA